MLRPLSILLDGMDSQNNSSATCSWKAEISSSVSGVIARAQGLNARFREELFLDLVRWDTTKLRGALSGVSVPALVLQST